MNLSARECWEVEGIKNIVWDDYPVNLLRIGNGTEFWLHSKQQTANSIS